MKSGPASSWARSVSRPWHRVEGADGKAVRLRALGLPPGPPPGQEDRDGPQESQELRDEKNPRDRHARGETAEDLTEVQPEVSDGVSLL